MAGEIPDLHAQERTGTGKGAARAARRDGMVPGIVFGGDVDPLPINIPFNKLLTMLKAGRFKSTLFEDEAPGFKKGGVLTVIRIEIELLVTAGDIPEKIEVDLAGLDIGDTITISDVTLPQGAKTTIDRDFMIANISAPSALKSEDDEGEDEAVDAADVPTTSDEEGEGGED